MMARHLIRIVVGIAGIVASCFLFNLAGSAGFTRYLSAVSAIQSSVDPADLALKIGPRDPEAHYSRGVALTNRNRLVEAEAEFETAIRLRPYHYYEWLDLGVTLDRLGDTEGAVAAIRESIRLAPSFSQPHWQLGNLLYRQGKFDEGFAELRRGAESNPNLMEGMLALAWSAADGDVAKLNAFIQPATNRTHLLIASFLARQGNGEAAAQQVAKAAEPFDAFEKALAHQTILTLLSTGQFRPAYSAWAASHPKAPAQVPTGQVLNPDFVEPITQDDPGFGWQIPPIPSVAVSIDPAGPSGKRSLRVQFSGESAPGTPLAHQLVLPKPNTRYSLEFFAKAGDLVTGGPPVIAVLDVSTEPAKILGQSPPITAPNSDWTRYQVDFSTEQSTTAIRISSQRVYCNQSTCPVFGALWLSGFRLIEVRQ